MDWFFSGLGTAILTFIFGSLIGGATGYKIAIKKNNSIRQNQKAGNNSSQVQVGRDYKND